MIEWQLVTLVVTWLNCGVAMGFFYVVLNIGNNGGAPV